MKLISTDDHVVEHPRVWSDRLPARYQEAGPSFVDSYLEFLAAGGSQRPDELVRSVGMDITDPGFWDAGLQILEEMVGQVEQLAGRTRL